MIGSLEEAVNYTIKKQNYNPNIIPQILDHLRKGNFDVLTSDNGARAYARSLSPEQLQYEINNYGQKKSNSDNMIKSLEEAVNYTIKKQNYNPSIIPQMLAYLRNGHFDVLTSDNGARAYARSLSPEQLQSQINSYGQNKSKLEDVLYIIEDMKSFNEKNGQTSDNKSIISDLLFDILNGKKAYTVQDGSIFSSIDLKNAMIEKSLLHAKENYGNAQSLDYVDFNSQINGINQASRLIMENINDVNMIYQAIDNNVSLSETILEEIIRNVLDKNLTKAGSYSLSNWRIKFNKILNDMNINDQQKAYVLFKKITDNEINYIDTDVNLVNRLNEISTTVLRLMTLVNSVNLSIYSESITSGISEQERSLYSGNNNYDIQVLQNIIEINRKILANLFEANSKYGKEGVCQYINNLSIGDLEFLCQLYINSNCDKNRQSMMTNIDTIFPENVHPSVKMLREELKQVETYQILSKIEEKTY